MKNFISNSVLLLLVITSNFLYSQKQDDLKILDNKFSEANIFYNNSDYQNAIELYNAIIDSGYHSSELYYNLGNSYYKINDIANSILYFEKSIKLNPSDKDVINNLNIVNNSTIDEIEKLPESFFDIQINKISNILGYSDWGIILIIFSFLFLILFITYFFSNKSSIKRFTFSSLIILIIFMGLTLKISFHAYKKNHLEKHAIIFASKVDIKSDPNETSENLVILHVGTKVKIIETINDEWVKIKLVNGQEGFIKKNEIKII